MPLVCSICAMPSKPGGNITAIIRTYTYSVDAHIIVIPNRVCTLYWNDITYIQYAHIGHIWYVTKTQSISRCTFYVKFMHWKCTENAVHMYITVCNAYVTEMAPLHSVVQQNLGQYVLFMYFKSCSHVHNTDII